MISQIPVKGVSLALHFEGDDKKRHLTVLQDIDYVKMPIFTPLDGPPSGNLEVILEQGTVLEHRGIFIEIYGRLEEKGNTTSYYFLRGKIDLDPPRTLHKTSKFWFKFHDFQRQPETVYGINVKVRYYLLATVNRGSKSPLTIERDFAIFSYYDTRRNNAGQEMNIGQEDKILVQYRQDKLAYDLNELLNAKITVNNPRMRIKEITATFGRKEKLFSFKLSSWNKNMTEDILEEFDLTDKFPKECGKHTIFFKLPLSNYKLYPSYVFQTQEAWYVKNYFLKIRVVGEDDFSAAEENRIELWRKPPEELMGLLDEGDGGNQEEIVEPQMQDNENALL